jgi:predicted GH43/DUF377 family glycosyl hydrolase
MKARTWIFLLTPLLIMFLWPDQELTASSSQAEAQLSAPVRISDDQGDDEDASVILARDGRFYMAWSSKRQNGVNLYIKSSEDGRTWSTEDPVTTGPGEDYYPALAQTRDGTFHIAWFRLERAQADIDIWYSRSQDARTWAIPVQITSSPKVEWAPSIHVDSRDALRIVWSSGKTGNRELYVSKSDDGGRQWSCERQITQSDEEDDFPHMIETSKGEWVLAWTRYRKGSPLLDYFKDTSAEIVIARSRDSLNWSVPEVSSPPDEKERHMDLLPFVFEDAAGGQLYLSWTSSRSNLWGNILLRNLASEASAYRLLTTESTSDYNAKIAPTKTPGQYLMAWASDREGKREIYSRTFHLQ